jgi:hypothetical protein
MLFSDLEVLAGQISRDAGYVRENIYRIWTPGAGSSQVGFCRELAGALFLEADEFFDRALMLYLLRTRLRGFQASTWANVASYYSNYFSATSFMRLHLRSVTHLVGGAVFSVEPQGHFVFAVSERKRRLAHTDVWRQYYDLVAEMGWPDSTIVSLLSPTVSKLRFREQLFRERVNYRAGEGFAEIYVSATRYSKMLRTSLELAGSGHDTNSMDDAAYNEHLARERLKHLATLLHRLRAARKDSAIESSFWERRGMLVERYAATPGDKQYAFDILGGT